MRSKKSGSDLELLVMSSISRTLKRLAPESRNRIVNWLASQNWAEVESAPTVDPRQATLGLS